MSEIESRNLKPRVPSRFLGFRILRGFSKREIAVAEKEATANEFMWLELEAWLFEKGRIGK